MCSKGFCKGGGGGGVKGHGWRSERSPNPTPKLDLYVSTIIVPFNFSIGEDSEESEGTGNKPDVDRPRRAPFNISKFVYSINERFYGHRVAPL